MAWRNAGMPVIGAYWLWPSRIARSSASTSRSGTGKSGKPWPRFTAWCSIASCDMTVKMVVPTFGSLVWTCIGPSVRGGRECEGLECEAQDARVYGGGPGALNLHPMSLQTDLRIATLLDAYYA